MRSTPSCAARILTIISLVFLSTLSFTLVYGDHIAIGESPSVVLSSRKREFDLISSRNFAFVNARQADTGPEGNNGSVSSISQSSVTSTSQAPSSTAQTSSAPPSSSVKQSSSTAEFTSTSIVSASSASPSPSSSFESSFSATPSSGTTSTPSSTIATSSITASASPSTSSPSSGSSSSASLASSTSASTSAKSSASATSAQVTQTASVAVVAETATFATASRVVSTSSAATASQTSISGAASTGFFSNKAAVAGTFAAVGVVALIIISGLILVYVRRRNAKRELDDEDFTYFEKPSTSHDGFDRGEELGGGSLGMSATDIAIAPTEMAAYPDRGMHYGQPDAYGISQQQPRGMQPSAGVYNPTEYGIEYPPGTEYRASAYDPRGDPYQQAAEYDPYAADPAPVRRTSPSGTHPFADPANTMHAQQPPPVSYTRGASRVPHGGYEPSLDSFYGANGAGIGAGRA